MDFEGVFFGIVLMILFALIIIQIDHEQTKEIELIKNNKDYVIHQYCENLNGEWYCYD